MRALAVRLAALVAVAGGLEAVLLGAMACGRAPTSGGQALTRIAAPPAGKLYHGAYPGGTSGEEDDITAAGVRSYEQAVGKRAAWVCFSHNWYQGTGFPAETVGWIRELGAAPYIRLMLRGPEEERGEQFTVESVLRGELDGELRRWAEGARRYGGPLIVEYGTECNGNWSPWNGEHHGNGRMGGFGDPKKPDGPERFAEAYRRVVRVMREAGAGNITWVFHIDAYDDPEVGWNRFENYYPGDEWVDWIGVSVYGPQEPTETEAASFRETMDECYARLEQMAKERSSKGKPVVVAEFGCTAGSAAARPTAWAGAALDDLLRGRWPRVIGFSWWNENWENDDDPAHNTVMRVEGVPGLAEVFRSRLSAAGGKIEERPVVGATRE